MFIGAKESYIKISRYLDLKTDNHSIITIALLLLLLLLSLDLTITMCLRKQSYLLANDSLLQVGHCQRINF